MVTKDLDKDEFISRVKAVLDKLPQDIAEINFEDKEYEYCIDVRPKSDKHCSFWMGFSTYGTYGLCFGHGLCFEDLSFKEFPPDETANAILQGMVKETIWSRKKRVVRAEGSIKLQGGQVLTDKAVLTILGAFGGEKKEMNYYPYNESV